jgi:hypothetical protein
MGFTMPSVGFCDILAPLFAAPVWLISKCYSVKLWCGLTCLVSYWRTQRLCMDGFLTAESTVAFPPQPSIMTLSEKKR